MRRLPYFAALLAFAAALATLASGPGYRFGWWSLNTGFALLRSAALAAVAAAILCLVVALWARLRKKKGLIVVSLCGASAGLIACGVPYATLRLARGLPAIHDITTDPANPPEFIALRAERLAAPNGIEYGGRHVAADQRASYPDIGPLSYAGSPEQAFARCLEIVQRLGWALAAAEPRSLRIEATERSLFFGFRDDVVIRITPLAGGKASRIDLRSVSRIGGGDFGVNAKRVRRLMRELAPVN